MKLENTKKAILRPFLAGVIGLSVGGGLFLLYYFKVLESSTAAYVINGAIAFVGVLAMITTIFVAINQVQKLKVKKEGEVKVATYISHETHTSAGKENYYNVTFSYELNGEKIIKKSKAEFVWKEVLTLKAIKNFNIKVLNGRVVMDDDIEELFEKNKELVKLEQQKYDEAYSKVEQILGEKK